MLALRMCMALLTALSYRLLFASERELTIAAVFLTVLCAVSCTVLVFPEEVRIDTHWRSLVHASLASATDVVRDFLFPPRGTPDKA